MPTAYSIRKSLQGELHEFLQESGFVNCTHSENLIRDLTALLAAYREEDVPLYPSVFVLHSIDELALFAPAADRVLIGRSAPETVSAPSILKNCAPLAHSGWSIYVGKSPATGEFQYGVFRSLTSTVSASSEEIMLEEADKSSILVIQNRGHLVVELRNSRKGVFTASLTSEVAKESAFVTDVATLVTAVAAQLPLGAASSFKPYLQRFLVETLQRSHGALCAVHNPPANGQVPTSFSNSIWLSAALPWCRWHAEAKLDRSADALARLQALESLVIGMLRSDGVVVFGSDGTVLAYRAFLSATEEERRKDETDGGGRRRTYALMKGRLGTDLRAAFFRSQDGASACEGAKQ